MKRLLAVVVIALALPASALAWGGSYPSGDSMGTFVHIEVSDSYPVDDALPQDWATYLGSLVHGPELARLTLDLMPLSDVQAQCGSQALACYDPTEETIFASPEDQLDSPPAREIVTHEYGHHVAYNSKDSPWDALDYGTKRWSSYENICAKAAGGTASPGDEGVSLLPELGRGVRRVVPRAQPAEARPPGQRLEHRRPELLSRRDRADAAAGRHHHAVGRADGLEAPRFVRHRRRAHLQGADTARRHAHRTSGLADEGEDAARALQRRHARRCAARASATRSAASAT